MIADILFPEIHNTPENILSKYPKRKIGGEVTRIAPSPTGFFHLGTLYTTLVDEIFAHKRKGILFLRAEDTDQKREIEGAMKKYVDILNIFQIQFDEGPIGENYQDVGEYGPYTQSQREYIYKVFLYDLVKKGLAYPCFLSEDEILQTRSIQEASKIPTGIYGEFSPRRQASLEQVQQALKDGKKFVIRLKSKGNIATKIEVDDLIKGKVRMAENFLDIVLMKINGLPTYHFAHVVDDYLMGTTLVIRGDEWFASLPLHLQLFETMEWQPPKYAHIAPLVKIEDGKKRKLSKRKDIEANVEFFLQEGYLPNAIIDYLCNLINAGYEEWKGQNGEKSYREYDFFLEKMNTAGALLDIDKMKWVNANSIKLMDLPTLYRTLSHYLEIYQKDFYDQVFLSAKKEYNEKILLELQSRITKFDEYPLLTQFFYQDFGITQEMVDLLVNPKMKIETLDMAKKSLELVLMTLLSHNSDFLDIEEVKNIFIQAIQEAQMKNGQVLWPTRVALSGEQYSPGAFELISILGKEKSIQRIQKILAFMKK